MCVPVFSHNKSKMALNRNDHVREEWAIKMKGQQANENQLCEEWNARSTKPLSHTGGAPKQRFVLGVTRYLRAQADKCINEKQAYSSLVL